jgi:hypothetical protein
MIVCIILLGFCLIRVPVASAASPSPGGSTPWSCHPEDVLLSILFFPDGVLRSRDLPPDARRPAGRAAPVHKFVRGVNRGSRYEARLSLVKEGVVMHQEWLHFLGAVAEDDKAQRITFAVPPLPAGRYTERLAIYDACGLTASLSASAEDDQQLRLLAGLSQVRDVEEAVEEAVGDLFCERADEGLAQLPAAPERKVLEAQHDAHVRVEAERVALEGKLEVMAAQLATAREQLQPPAAPASRCELPQSEAPVQPAGSCLSLEPATYQAPSVHDLVDVDADNARKRRMLLKTQSSRCDCLGKILVYRGHPTRQVSSEHAFAYARMRATDEQAHFHSSLVTGDAHLHARKCEARESHRARGVQERSRFAAHRAPLRDPRIPCMFVCPGANICPTLV